MAGMKYFLLIIALVARPVLAADKKDPAQSTIIEQAIRTELKKLTGELTKADLDKVRWLELVGDQMTDVKGLEKLRRLQVLYLDSNKLTELPKGLENLTNLMVLHLDDNPDLTQAQIDQLQKALLRCTIHHNATK